MGAGTGQTCCRSGHAPARNAHVRGRALKHRADDERDQHEPDEKKEVDQQDREPLRDAPAAEHHVPGSERRRDDDADEKQEEDIEQQVGEDKPWLPCRSPRP